MDDYVVEMKGICKSFSGVQALKNVDLELRRGEIMGIVGDNGAGKSTLMKVLSGAHLADEGEVFIDGKKAHIRNPQDAYNLGIGMIYQDLALFNNLDVARNIFVGRELVHGPLSLFLDKKSMYKKAESLIRDLRVDIKSPKLNVARMSGGQRQMIACARAIAFDSKILIMDEPTAALGVTEANKLLGLIRNLKTMGLSILLITQRIPDILAIADRVFVLKGGQRQDILEVSQVTLDDVVTMIVKGKDRNGNHPVAEVEYKSFG
ncbi:MAG: sugar ABC transporter ATP-binding protein [Anaerolineales bacterium]|nr:sugar ABC transporter ATP-binding protein [Anaerolineales bacterium]NTW12615.1 sugar ABC transporter ATP-binding protein [Anaerolineales bacterium]